MVASVQAIDIRVPRQGKPASSCSLTLLRPTGKTLKSYLWTILLSKKYDKIQRPDFFTCSFLQLGRFCESGWTTA
jgi:hypothetical protein